MPGFHPTAMPRRAMSVVGAFVIGLACQDAPSGDFALRDADLASARIHVDFTQAEPCSTGEWTSALPASRKGGWSHRVYQVRSGVGGILTAELTSTAGPAQLLLAEREGDALIILDSERVRATARVAREMADDAQYYLLVASGADRESDITLTVGTRAPHAFGSEGDPAAAYAVLASIEDYPRERVDLKGPHRDASLMRDLLIKTYGFPPENVVMLRDEEVTRRGVIEVWLGHLRRAGPDGMALFYFSGHGIQLEQAESSTFEEDDGKDEALLLADGTVLIDQELGTLASRLRAGRTMIILDNCYAGTGTRGSGGAMKRTFVDKLDFPLRRPARLFGSGTSKGAITESPASYVLLAASAEDEVAWITDEPPRDGAPVPVSVFTWFLVEELSTAVDGATLDDVMRNVHRRTLSFVQRTFNENQTPHREGARGDTPAATFLGSS